MCESKVCPWEPQKAEGRSDTSGPRPLPDHFRLIIMMNNNQLKLDFLFSVIFYQLCSFADLRIVVNMRLMVWVVLSTGSTNPRSRRRRLRLGRPRRLHGWFGFCLLSFLAIFHRARGKIGHWKTLNDPWFWRLFLCHISSSKTMLLFGLASISQVDFPPTVHTGIWMSFDVSSGKNTRQSRSRITSFFVEAPRWWDLKQKKWISWMSGR